MTIKVCVGSSCHLKGSYEVIEAFKEVLKKVLQVQELHTIPNQDLSKQKQC